MLKNTSAESPTDSIYNMQSQVTEINVLATGNMLWIGGIYNGKAANPMHKAHAITGSGKGLMYKTLPPQAEKLFLWLKP